MRSKLVKDYIKPTRIVAASPNVVNAKALLVNSEEQISFTENNALECYGKGYIILDFGKELQGGVRILSHYIEGQKTDLDVRIRFGESVNEACAELNEKNARNDHSVRDMCVVMPDLSDLEWGQTGFRFVRLDFLNEDKLYRIVNVYASFVHRGLEYKSELKTDDSLINDIYDTARYTVYLNMQEHLLEGIKRDRLVWIGDMQPEVLAITDIFGADWCIEDALEHSVEKNPLPGWMRITTYSFWFIQILCDYYLKTRDEKFLKKFLSYAEGIIEQMDSCVLENGVIDYARRPDINTRLPFFLDWPTSESPCAKAGCRYVYLFVTKNFAALLSEVGKDATVCLRLIHKLEQQKEGLQDMKKQVVAFGYLAGQIDKVTAAKLLTEGGAKGLCTYHSYFILRAIAETAGVQVAVDILKEYYGGMLSRGATSFWEDFNVEWLEGSGRIDEITPVGLKDLHGDYGDYCYKGFRHSLCHGWSCGPVQFLTEYVMGVRVLDAGYRRVAIAPNLAGMQRLQAKVPTPYGEIKIIASQVNGQTIVRVEAPREIEIINKGE
jgi:hypothetical protein